MPRLVHVAGVRNATEKDLRTALAPVPHAITEDTEVHFDGGWRWVIVTERDVPGVDVDAALQALQGPFLRITPEDGERWLLTLGAHGEEPYRLCHEFSDLYFLDGLGEDDDSDTSDEFTEQLFQEMLDGYAQMGCPIAEEIVDGLRELPWSAMQQELRYRFGVATSRALQRLGVPHESLDIIDILTGAEGTWEELDTPLGNLPRFLVALGFGHVFEMTLAAQIEDGDMPAELEDDYSADDQIDAILDVTKDVEALPVLDGPVQLPLRRLRDLNGIGSLRRFWTYPLLRITYPDGQTPPDEWKTVVDPSVRVEGRDVLVVLELVHGTPKDILTVLLQLEAIPEGAQFELRVSHYTPIEGEPAEPHAFSGVVGDGVILVEKAWPHASAIALEDAFRILEEIEAQEGLEARDEAEIGAVLDLARDSFEFGPDHLPRRDGLRLIPGTGADEELGRLFFQHRWNDVWECAGEWD